MEKYKIILSVIIGVTVAFCEEYGAIIVLVSVAIVFDLITGTVRGAIARGLNSKKCFKGLIKKFALLLGLLFGIFIDYLIPMLLNISIDITLPFSMPMGYIIGAYILLNECISILENLYQSGVPIPKFVCNFSVNLHAVIKYLKLNSVNTKSTLLLAK